MVGGAPGAHVAPTFFHKIPQPILIFAILYSWPIQNLQDPTFSCQEYSHNNHHVLYVNGYSWIHKCKMVDCTIPGYLYLKVYTGLNIVVCYTLHTSFLQNSIFPRGFIHKNSVIFISPCSPHLSRLLWL